MANLNKVDVPVAQQNKCKLDLSCDHVTTMDFMQLQPVFYRHMVAGEHINFDSYSVCRPAPMAVPTYGRLRMNLRGFFVPYRLVFPFWNEFHLDTIASGSSSQGIPQNPPYFTAGELFAAFSLNNDIRPVGDADPYDVILNDTRFVFSVYGRRFYKVILSLGYDLISKDAVFNGLALLSLFKVYYDWYSNSQYLNNQNLLLLNSILQRSSNPDGTHLDVGTIYNILNFVCVVNYDSEGYFDDAWDTPSAPTLGNSSVFSISDITLQGSTRVISEHNTDFTPVMVTADPTAIGSTYIHSALKKLTDYQRRHQLSGARTIDRFLASVGIKSEYLRLMRSVYVGFDTMDINIGDIYATANGVSETGSSEVGDYAGRGFGNSQKSWDFTCEEDGFFVVCGSIVPSGGYVDGIDRNNLNFNRLDFFTPEFDGLGTQDILKAEVWGRPNQAGGSEWSEIFGFTGRYGQYKRPLSRLSGDFVLGSVMPGGDSWNLFRHPKSQGRINVAHDELFTKGYDSLQYHRIFNYVPDTEGVRFDPFYCFFHFAVGSYFPGKPLFETYDFEEERNKIRLASNGSEMN